MCIRDSDNPCGIYRRAFELPETPADYRHYLNFEGVDSCFYVWMNGRFIGYSQVLSLIHI